MQNDEIVQKLEVNYICTGCKISIPSLFPFNVAFPAEKPKVLSIALVCHCEAVRRLPWHSVSHYRILPASSSLFWGLSHIAIGRRKSLWVDYLYPPAALLRQLFLTEKRHALSKLTLESHCWFIGYGRSFAIPPSSPLGEDT